MPDSYDNVGPATATPTDSSTPEVRLKIHHGDPSLAVTGSIEKPVPIEPAATPVLPNNSVESRPDQGHPSPAQSGMFFSPLQGDVAPFRTADPRVPATEYVNLNPVRLPRPVPRPVPHYRPHPVTQPASLPPAPVPPSAPAPVSPPLPITTGQAIGPIIRKRPTASTRVVQPVSARPSPASLPPAPVPPAAAPSPPPPPPTPAPPTPTPPVTPSVTAPISAPQPQAASPQSITEVQAAPITPSVVSDTATSPAVSSDKPLKIYSNNTRMVWQIRRSGKVLYSVAVCGLLLVLFGLFFYWKSLGSPTNIQDIPLLHLH